MENKESNNTVIAYLKSICSRDLNIDEEAVDTSYKNQEKQQQSIIIKILTIIGSLMTCLFGVGFTILFGWYQYPVFMIVFGLFLIILSSYLSTRTNEIFLDTLLLSLYCSGYGFFGFGASESGMDVKIILTCFLAFSSITVLYLNNYILAFIATLTSLIVIYYLITILNITDFYSLFRILVAIAMLYILVQEAKIITFSKHLSYIYEPVKIAFIVFYIYSLIDTSIFNFFDIDNTLYLNSSYNIILFIAYAIVIVCLLFYMLSLVLKTLTITNGKQKVFIYITTFVLLLPTTIQPNIAGALLLIVSCFYVNYKTGFVLGILSFLFFISRFYYDMNVTLLFKSIVLMTTGILFIVVYYMTSKKLTTNEKD